MNNNFSIGLLIFLSLLMMSCTNAPTPILLTPQQYVVSSGNEEMDYGSIFHKMIDDARTKSRAGHEVTIDLGTEVYHIYPDDLERYELFISNHDHVPERAVAFYVDSIDHLTIKGDGAKLLFHGRQIPFVIRRSEGVTLEGFSIDYPRPALSQVEVISFSGEDPRVVVLPETHYRIEENQFVLEGEDFEQPLYVAMPFGADRHMKAGRADVSFDPHEIIPNDDGTLTLKGWSESPYLRVGDRYVLRSYYRPTPGIVLMDDQDITVKKVHVHYAEGMGLVAQNTRNVMLDGFAVDVELTSDRFFTTQADATHFSGCRGVIRSSNGLYEHMADDAINVHGTYLRGDNILDTQTIIASFAHEQSFGYTWYEEGDTLRIIDRQTLLPLTDALQAIVVPISEKQLKITITTPGLDISVFRDKKVAVENLSAHPAVLFEHNTIRNNRARGALFSTPKSVLCADNFFDHTHGSAILLSGDANGWYESGPCEDLTIRGNRFLNALTAMYQFTNGVISIDPAIPVVVEGHYYHGHVVVEDNIFETFDNPLYYAKSVRSFEWRNNKVIPNEDYTSIFADRSNRLINVGTMAVD